MNKNIVLAMFASVALIPFNAEAGKVHFASKGKLLGYALIGGGAASVVVNSATQKDVIVEGSAEAVHVFAGFVAGAGLAASGGSLLIGGVISDLSAEDGYEKEVSAAQFKALLATSENIQSKGPQTVDPNFEILMTRFDCPACSTDEEKSEVLARTLLTVNAVAAGMTGGSVSERKTEKQLKEILGENATQSNVDLSKRIIAASIVYKN